MEALHKGIAVISPLGSQKFISERLAPLQGTGRTGFFFRASLFWNLLG